MNGLKTRSLRILLFLLSLYGFLIGTSLSAKESLSCDLSFQGILDEPQVSRFIDKYAKSTATNGQPKLPAFSILCLDSPGGDYAQAMKLIGVIETSTGVVTYIPKGAECSSACSLIFLSGNTWIGQGATKQYNARIIHAGGTLGFHAPFTNFDSNTSFSGRDGNKIFALAVKALSEANSLRLQKRSSGEEVFNDFLFSGFLSTPPEKLFYVKTVGDAVLADIDVRGLPVMQAFKKNDIYRVCDLAIAKRVIKSSPTLLYGGQSSASILSLVSSARERFTAENKASSSNYQEAIEGVTSDQFGIQRAAWLLQGYPSPTHHNNGFVCLVEVHSPKRQYFETWSSGQKQFLEVDTFRYTIFDVGRDADFASTYSIDNFISDHARWITSSGSLPNWSALPADYQIFLD